jgi:hypothetical protein
MTIRWAFAILDTVWGVEHTDRIQECRGVPRLLSSCVVFGESAASCGNGTGLCCGTAQVSRLSVRAISHQQTTSEKRVKLS